MKKLFVLYDSDCAFCRECRRWLEAQPAYFELCFLPARSAEAECRIPGIQTFVATNELIVVGDDGAVYQGSHAFILCLYALVEFREWSLRLARPALLPFARQFFDFICHHRGTFSQWMRNNSDAELASSLRGRPAPECGNETLNCIAAVRTKSAD
jgi:predicted DCC family thiol-disulfide oxidoreductase YuxK